MRAQVALLPRANKRSCYGHYLGSGVYFSTLRDQK